MANAKEEKVEEIVVEEVKEEKVLLYMRSGASYMTGSGVRFTKDHPYQLVVSGEATALLKEDRFRLATARDLKEYYQLGEAPINIPLTTASFINGDVVPEA